MSNRNMKMQAASAALTYIPEGTVIGIGTGSTINCLIELLSNVKDRINAIVPSSIATEKLLRDNGLEVTDFNSINKLSLYIDGADSYNSLRQLVKGAGGALTREKILAYASEKFICLVDETKSDDIIGSTPIPIEVLPMARSYAAREIIKLKGNPILRQGFTTDNGNVILDIHNWEITQPIAMEEKLNNIPGIVANGIFASREADTILIGHKNSVTVL